jgi:hypothetical protein
MLFLSLFILFISSTFPVFSIKVIYMQYFKGVALVSLWWVKHVSQLSELRNLHLSVVKKFHGR